jgi:hypothetical protein
MPWGLRADDVMDVEGNCGTGREAIEDDIVGRTTGTVLPTDDAKCVGLDGITACDEGRGWLATTLR